MWLSRAGGGAGSGWGAVEPSGDGRTLREPDWGTRVGLELGRFVPLPRAISRGWPILALERLNRDSSDWRHRTAPKLEFQ